jgi:hypothetical protein
MEARDGSVKWSLSKKAVVFDAFRVLTLWQQYHDGLIDDMEFPSVKMSERVKCQHYLCSYCTPSQQKESRRESVGRWRLV